MACESTHDKARRPLIEGRTLVLQRLTAADEVDRGLGCLAEGDAHREALDLARAELGVVPVVTRAVVGLHDPASDDRCGVGPHALELEPNSPSVREVPVQAKRVVLTLDIPGDPGLGDLSEPTRSQGPDGEQHDQRTTDSLHIPSVGLHGMKLERLSATPNTAGPPDGGRLT